MKGDKNMHNNMVSIKIGGIVMTEEEYRKKWEEQRFRKHSQIVKSAINDKISSGEFLPASGSIPYGYLRNADNNTYIIDDETYLVVRKIYSMRADNATISAIVKYLNEEGIPSPNKIRYLRGMIKDEKSSNSMWNRSTVRKILNDISYIGHRVHGRKQKETYNSPKKVTSSESWTIIKDAHPAIISQELFDKVQEVNRKEQDKLAKQEKRAEVEKDYRQVLRGKIFCADCGKPMIGKKSSAKVDSNKKNYIFYECSSYYSSKENCSTHYIREDTIVSEVASKLDDYKYQGTQELTKEIVDAVIEKILIDNEKCINIHFK